MWGIAMKWLGFLAAGAALLGTAVAPAGAANLIKNASFENPVTPDGTYIAYSTGQKFDHWLVVGDPGNVATVNADFTYCGHTYTAKKGTAFVDLTGTSDTATGVQQTIATTPGATYALTFNIGNVYDTVYNCGTTSTVEVLIDGENVGSFTNKAGQGSTVIVWRKYSTEFVAQDAKTTIALINGDPGPDTANGLDAVSVTLVH
jgi:Protein of unknown function (DUF642)